MVRIFCILLHELAKKMDPYLRSSNNHHATTYIVRTIFFSLTREICPSSQKYTQNKTKFLRRQHFCPLFCTQLQTVLFRGPKVSCFKFKHWQLDLSWFLLKFISIFFLKFWDIWSFLCWPGGLFSVDFYHITSWWIFSQKYGIKSIVSALQK